MARSHGSSSFVMPLEGSGSVARPFCCRAGAWWPTLACDGDYLRLRKYPLCCPSSVNEPPASKGGVKEPEVMAPHLL